MNGPLEKSWDGTNDLTHFRIPQWQKKVFYQFLVCVLIERTFEGSNYEPRTKIVKTENCLTWVDSMHCKYLNARSECNDIVISVYSHYPLDLNAKSSDTKCVTLSDLAFRYLQSRVPNCYKLDQSLAFAHPKSGKVIKTTRYQDFIYKTLELGLLIKVHTFSCNILYFFLILYIILCLYIFV